MELSGRRTLLSGLMAGGLLGVGARADAVTPVGASLIPARGLRVGDLVVGPHATVVRVASLRKLATKRYQVRYTDPVTGAAHAIDSHVDRIGFSATKRFVVLLRGVPQTAVRISSVAASTPTPTPTQIHPLVVDGGAP